MPPINKPLTLKLLIFEVTDGTRTLTDDAAEQFVLFFNESTQWHSTIHQVDVAPGVHGHYEMRLVHRTVTCGHTPASQSDVTEAIDTLCYELCHPDGLLSPKRVNPNPNLVFTVGVDLNSPADDLFLHNFIKHSARSTASADAPPRRASTASSIPSPALGNINRELAASASSAFLTFLGDTPNQGPDWIGQLVIRPVATAAMTRIVGAIYDFCATNSKEINTTVNEIQSSLEELQGIVPGHDAAIELPAALERFAELRLAMSTAEGQRKDTGSHRTRAALFGCFTTAVALVVGFSLASPAFAASVAAVLPAGTARLAGSLPVTVQYAAPIASGLGTIVSWGKAYDDTKDLRELDEATRWANRRLFALAMAMLKTNYQHKPNAPMVARLAMDVASVVNPALLED